MTAMTAVLQRVGPALKIAGQVVQSVMLISVFGMNVLMGYIMFAPDDLPKPFYLSYAGDAPVLQTVVTTGGEGGVAGVTAAGEGAVETHKVYVPGEGYMVETGTKIVNLADPGGRRYLKATITIEVTPPETSAATEAEAAASGSHGSTTAAAEGTVDPAIVEFNDKMNQRLPIINDILTTMLSGQTFESIYTVEGKERLREAILAELNDKMPDLKVISVYFTEFVVQ